MKNSNKFKNVFVFIVALIILAFGLTLLIWKNDFVDPEANDSGEFETESIYD